MNFIIDTNVLIEVEKGNEEVIKRVQEIAGDDDTQICITPFTFEEYYYGFIEASEDDRTAAIESVKKYGFLKTSFTTFLLTTEIVYIMKKKGKPIPKTDVFNASQAIEYNMPIITMDKHFKQIPAVECILI